MQKGIQCVGKGSIMLECMSFMICTHVSCEKSSNRLKHSSVHKTFVVCGNIP